MKQITADARYVEESYMAYTKTEWKDRTVENARTFTMTENDDGTVTLEEAPGEVYEAGTPLNAENMNHIEDGIEQLNSDIEDTGWLNLTLSNNFKNYSSESKQEYRRIGKTVFLRGVMSPKTNIPGSIDETLVATIPEGFRPSRTETRLCQGSIKNTWLLTVNPNGKIGFSRYGTTSNTTASADAWLPFSINYPVG